MPPISMSPISCLHVSPSRVSPSPVSCLPISPSPVSLSRISCLVAILLAFALRVYALDAKGLSYDEAATALMARATPTEIIAFHWRAAFEHPPIWQLLMHGWSQLVGQSEFALRYISVLAGVLLIPLLYQLARSLQSRRQSFTIHHSPSTIHHSLLILTVFAPILIYYSQEARMYALVVTAAIAAVIALERLLTSPTRWAVHSLIFLHWFMLGLHYYSVLLVVAEGIFCLLWLVASRAPRSQWVTVFGALTIAVAPLVGWLAFAPGFHDTLRITLTDNAPNADTLTFLAEFWRELSFASVRWEVAQSRWGYLWLPLVGLGIGYQLWASPAGRLLQSLPLLATILPIMMSAFFFPTLATRYLLYVVPFLLLLMAAGIGWLHRIHWSLAAVGLLIALAVPAQALPHYYGSYQKSAYREMARTLMAAHRVDEALLLEAPRQHLLAKYYLNQALPTYTAPLVELPPFWPVNAPPVVPEEMDDLIQDMLRDYRGIWLSLTAENEVDPGEFVPKYLTAVAFEVDCEAWLDVRLCHYLSPHAFSANMTTRIDALFADELLLQQVDLTLPPAEAPDMVLVTLQWQAKVPPRADYRVTLRLLDQSGATISQRDNYPIGPLLPPTTWQAGDEKPGFMALPLPAGLAQGRYQVTVNLYDPADGAPIPHTTAGPADKEPPAADTAAIMPAIITVGESIEVDAP